MTIKIPTSAVVIGPDETFAWTIDHLPEDATWEEPPIHDHEGNPFVGDVFRIIIWFRTKDEALAFYGQLER